MSPRVLVLYIIGKRWTSQRPKRSLSIFGASRYLNNGQFEGVLILEPFRGKTYGGEGVPGFGLSELKELKGRGVSGFDSDQGVHIQRLTAFMV